ncbi:hypothetical protein TKK_0003160 [Trichogramma kaykai]
MSERVQRKDEPIQQYFQNKVKLCADLRLSTEEMKEQVLVGLWSRDLFNAMSARTHVDVDALLHDMLDYEYRVRQRPECMRTSQSSSNSSSKKQQSGADDKVSTEKKVPRTGDRVKQPMRNEKGEFRCYNCQEYGHMSKDCSKPRADPYCVGCKTTGHFKRDYTNVVNEVSVSEEEPGTAARKYYKQARNISVVAAVVGRNLKSAERTGTKALLSPLLGQRPA